MQTVKLRINVPALFLLPLCKELEKIRYWVRMVKFETLLDSRLKVEEDEIIFISKYSSSFKKVQPYVKNVKWFEINGNLVGGITKVDENFVSDYNLIKEGKYSKLNKDAKKRIIEFWESPEIQAFLNGVFKENYRTYIAMIKRWEELTGETLDPLSEAYPYFSMEDVYFSFLGVDLKIR